MFAASREALDNATGLPGVGFVVTAARRVYQEALRDGIKGAPLDSADPQLHRYLAARIGSSPDEQMHAVFIDRHGGYIADETIATGGSATVPVRCRALFQRALAVEASAIILAHNHPSGRSVASREDVSVTEELVRIARQLELRILDHLIVTSSEVFSMKRAGLL
ncbi:MAG: JAB domain-containing protein [Novosphingobium sp.]